VDTPSQRPEADTVEQVAECFGIGRLLPKRHRFGFFHCSSMPGGGGRVKRANAFMREAEEASELSYKNNRFVTDHKGASPAIQLGGVGPLSELLPQNL